MQDLLGCALECCNSPPWFSGIGCASISPLGFHICHGRSACGFPQLCQHSDLHMTTCCVGTLLPPDIVARVHQSYSLGTFAEQNWGQFE